MQLGIQTLCFSLDELVGWADKEKVPENPVSPSASFHAMFSLFNRQGIRDRIAFLSNFLFIPASLVVKM